MTASKRQTRCRICGGADLFTYLDLGSTPLANSYLRVEQLDEPEFREELAIQVCTHCGLSQLTRVVNPDLMFRNYLYVSSTAKTFVDHCAEMAGTLSRAAQVGPDDLALDIASNDGCLLRQFQAAGMRVVGVDPAVNLATEANAAGVPTICDYWSPAVAHRVVEEFGRPKVITATNVVAHVDDLHAFMQAIDLCLAPGGRFAFECPYVLDFLEHNEFDTAYHEHLSYVGVTPITHLVGRYGFAVVDVEYFPMLHGGTVRVHAARASETAPSPRVADYLERERAFGITEPAPYEAFAARVEHVRIALPALLQRVRGEGRTVWAYGASAKGNTLANYIGLTAEIVPEVVDDNPKKWDLYCPGSHMHIIPTARLAEGQPDYLLLLAWNFQREIMRRSRSAGFRGEFIMPVPEPTVIASELEGVA